MEEWKEYKLHEIGRIVGGATPPTKDSANYDGEISWITPKDLSNFTGRYIQKGERSITQKGFDSSSCQILPKGSILFSSRAPIGYIAIAANELCTNQGFKSIIPDNNLVNNLFLYYLLKYNKEEIEGLGSGTTFKEVSAKVMQNFDIKIPSIQTQKKIADILSSLDDKIEVNKRINDNLEQQAQALFKSWFVDFEPFLREEFFKSDSLFGDIPVEWHIVAIKDLSVYITDYVANGSFASLRENVRLYDKPNYAHFIRNTDLKAESYKMYVDKHSYEFLSKSVLEGGEIIISNVGDVGSVFLCPKLEKPMTLGNNIILLRPKKDYLTFYLYMLFKGGIGQHLIDGVTGGSAQRKFNKTDFKSIKLMMPPVNILIKFDRIVKPIFSKIEENRDEISRLTSLRDTLLPKLMSGELKINDINN